MRDAVLATAKALCHPNNTVTTLEIKTKLIKDFPMYHWRQNVGNDSVSAIMNEFATQGVFTYIDNGTFRTYSDPTYVFPSQPAAKNTAATTPAPTVTTVGTTNAPKKRGPYNTKRKIAAAAAIARGVAALSTVPDPTPIPTVKKTLKTVKKAVSKTATITVGDQLRTMLANRAAKKGRATKISRHDAAQKLLDSTAAGKFGWAVFIKKDNTLREMNFKTLAGQKKDNLGYINVIDMKLYNSNGHDEGKATRKINLQTLMAIAIDKESYRVG